MKIKIQLAYSLFIVLVCPFLSIIIWLNMRKYGLQSRFKERFGLIKNTPADIWIHAASVGEIKASSVFIKKLATQNIIISTTTSTGFLEFRRQFSALRHFFFGFDLPIIWRRVLKRIRPKKLVLLEREVWPNLINECKKQNIEVFLINAKFSEKSAKKAKKLQKILLPVFNKFNKIYAQSDYDCQLLTKFGVDFDKCQSVGNLKFDIKAPKLQSVKLSQNPVWTAGSTRNGEEKILLNIHQKILETHPNALLVIAPRHPKRFLEVWKLIKKYPFSAKKYSETKSLIQINNYSVLLLDAIGHLMDFYAASDFCFVGGSLLKGVGGHNLLEPAILKKPVLSGQFLDEVKHTERLLGKSLVKFSDEESGFKAITNIINDEKLKSKLADEAYRAVQNNQGATDICVAGVLKISNKLS